MIRSLAVAGLLLPTLFSCDGFGQDLFFDSNGVRIRYIDRGEGPTVIFLHGFTVSLEAWTDSGVLPNIEQDHRVVAFDARGHGQSDKPHEREAYGREMGLDAIRLLDHLGIPKAHFIGYSMGAHIVAQLLTTHPDRVITATLGGGAGRFNWTEADTARYALAAAETEASCISKSMILRLRPSNQPQASEQELKKRSEACMADPNIDRFARSALLRGLADQAISAEQAASVEVPTLGIVGSLDPIIERFVQLKKLRPAVKLIVVEGASHGGSTSAYRRPEFVSAVREFHSSI